MRVLYEGDTYKHHAVDIVPAKNIAMSSAGLFGSNLWYEPPAFVRPTYTSRCSHFPSWWRASRGMEISGPLKTLGSVAYQSAVKGKAEWGCQASVRRAV